MKKVYKKPDIIFENFALSANIAAVCTAANLHASDSTCQYAVNSTNYNSCGFYDNGYRLFESTGICETTPEDEEWVNLCYHAPSDNNIIFAS